MCFSLKKFLTNYSSKNDENNKFNEMKKHNFYAGPSILSEFTKEETAKAVMDFAGTGLSVMEVSHRGKEFQAVMDDAVALVKELLEVPDGYEVLFLQGGASLQFCMVPFNLLNKKAAYLNTGAWAGKALKEAQLFGEVIEVASSKDANFSYIPKNYKVPSDVDYFHFTSNNTIFGTQLKSDPDVGVSLVADMSSDIFSRPIDISKYDLIYAGAQKNLAPSGVTLVIVKTEALGKVDRQIPTMLDYNTHIKGGSMFNTPPCIAVFAALQTLKWYKQQGGIAAMQKANIEKANVLYDELDRNKLFKAVVPAAEDRSVMNICFVMSEGNEALESDFLAFASTKGIVGIKGHRSVGGFRASTYNALPKESVQALVDAMKEFESNQ
jgi:phosphoserine aminotransferase